MNEKFFSLSLEKQDRMIKAAFIVFSKHGYKKAPMSEIANAGGISKALLFYYFKNKKELYLFLWNRVIEYTREVLSDYHVMETTDFFEMMKRSLLGKCALMRMYPYLYTFAIKAYYEKEPEIKKCIQKNFEIINQNIEKVILEQIDRNRFREGIDIRLLYREIVWAADGYLRNMEQFGKLNIDLVEHDFLALIQQWRKAYLQ